MSKRSPEEYLARQSDASLINHLSNLLLWRRTDVLGTDTSKLLEELDIPTPELLDILVGLAVHRWSNHALRSFNAPDNRIKKSSIKMDTGESIELSTDKSQLRVTENGGYLSIENSIKLRSFQKKTEHYLWDIDEAEFPSRCNLLNLYEEWKSLFEFMPGGASRHHKDPGGLSKHTAEVIQLALDMKWIRSSYFSEVTDSDIIVAGFLHDFSKIKMYRQLTPDEKASDSKGRSFKFDNKLGDLNPETWTIHQCMKHGVVLSTSIINALFYAEGGFSTWVRGHLQPEWTKLSVLISCADNYSAQVMG